MLFASQHRIKESLSSVCLMCFSCPVLNVFLLNEVFMQIYL